MVTFAPRSEITEERKVPEPQNVPVNCSSLLYLCDDCESSAMKGDKSAKLQSMLQDINASLSCMAANDHQEDTRNMLEKFLDKVDSIDLAVKAKADTMVEKKLQSLENKLHTNSEMMQKLEKEEADQHLLNCKVDEVVAMLSDK